MNHLLGAATAATAGGAGAPARPAMSRQAKSHLLGAAAGVALDRLVGEPPDRLHPVAGFGRVMRAAETRLWRDDRWAGIAGGAYAAGGVALGAAAGAGLPAPPGPATALAAGVAVAGRALGDTARAVAAALAAGDGDRARALLPALCGRDPDVLDDKGVARATVESVAENTVDAVVAPAFWAALGGAPGALAYRAVNTLDAMVGHRNARYARFGWAPARLDDAANWLPARLTALLVAAVRPGSARDVAAVLRRPPPHPSPNAAVSEAAFAAALGLRLGGDTVYAGRVDPRPPFGSGRAPEPADIEAAVSLSTDVTVALAAGLTATGLVLSVRRRRRP